MSSSTLQTFRCAACAETYTAVVYTLIDAEAEPELRERVIDGSLFIRECPHCGCRELINSPVIYKEKGHLVCLSGQPVAVEGLGDIVGRRVTDTGSLVEKVKIFAAGLDDAAVELCKFVTCNELSKDVSLRFVSLDGADNEMIFAYPEDGQMQMIATGFNVYENCRAIISRNPAMQESLKGLPCVDGAWVDQFMK